MQNKIFVQIYLLLKFEMNCPINALKSISGGLFSMARNDCIEGFFPFAFKGKQ